MQKFRKEYKVFVAEGEKIAAEWLGASGPVSMIVGTEEWAAANLKLVSRHPEAELCIVKEHVLETVSGLQAPNKVLLVVPVPEPVKIPILQDWYLALDDLQDPGNMGTVIRIADWFGIKHIVCSPGCVDVYNPKVVQGAMGSHLRVSVYESNLVPFLRSISVPVIAATLHGMSVYQCKRMDAGVLIIGNESKGISEPVLGEAGQQITIPRKGGAESLNAGVSAGILCALLLPC